MKAILSAGAAGLLFALGLGLGGMTDPARVVGFLDFTGAWVPNLAFVMGGALSTHTLLRRRILRRRAPVLAPAFPAQGNARPDVRLVAGAVLFGVGWGLAGYCPGPALTQLTSGSGTVPAFVAAMAVGMGLFELWARLRWERTRPLPSPAS